MNHRPLTSFLPSASHRLRAVGCFAATALRTRGTARASAFSRGLALAFNHHTQPNMTSNLAKASNLVELCVTGCRRLAGPVFMWGLVLLLAGCGELDRDAIQPIAATRERYVIVQAAGEVCVGVWDETTGEVQAWATVDANDLVMVELRADQIEPIIRRDWSRESTHKEKGQ